MVMKITDNNYDKTNSQNKWIKGHRTWNLISPLTLATANRTNGIDFCDETLKLVPTSAFPAHFEHSHARPRPRQDLGGGEGQEPRAVHHPESRSSPLCGTRGSAWHQRVCVALWRGPTFYGLRRLCSERFLFKYGLFIGGIGTLKNVCMSVNGTNIKG